MNARLPSFLAPSFAIALAELACGGRVDGVPSGATTNPPASTAEPAPGSGSTGGTTGNGPGSARPSDPAESCDLACDEGHTIVHADVACASGDACYTRTACGKSITCTGAAGLCDDPQCLGSTIEVKTCAPSADCETQQLCGRTLLCKRTDAQCDGLAACDEDDEEVASATECAKHGSRCYSRASCGHRTYCVRAP